MTTKQSEYGKGYQDAMREILNIIENCESVSSSPCSADTLDDVRTWAKNNSGANERKR